MDWIEVNGSKMERRFFEGNLAEAKTYSWKRKIFPAEFGHAHCMICTAPIPRKKGGDPEVDYHSAGGWLCSFCFGSFIFRQN